MKHTHSPQQAKCLSSHLFANLSGTLLPKLISGEPRISDTDPALAEVL